VVLLTGLGDVVHGLPVVNALRDSDPSLLITWVVEPMPSGILAGHRSIDNVIVFRRRDGFKGLRKLAADLNRVRPIDITLNLNVYLKSAFPTLLSRAPRRIGFDRARSFDGVWLASNERLPQRPRAHTADMFLEFAEHLGVPVNEPHWRLEFSEAERLEQSTFFDGMDGAPVATIIPSSATVKKDWVAERWAKVAESLQSDFGFRVVIAGGPGAREQGVAREIMQASSANILWALGDSVRRLAWIVDKSNLLLAPDTGPVHIARALGTPVIGLYAHTNPWRVGPWRAYEDLWVDHYTEPGAPPDPSNRKPRWDNMPTIEVNEVLERVQRATTQYGVLKSR
jgi:heptosyltransferase I